MKRKTRRNAAGGGETSGGSGVKQVGAGSSKKGKASTRKGVKAKRSRHDDDDDDCVIVDLPSKSRKTEVNYYTSTCLYYLRRLISGRHSIYQFYRRFSYVVLEYQFCVCILYFF